MSIAEKLLALALEFDIEHLLHWMSGQGWVDGFVDCGGTFAGGPDWMAVATDDDLAALRIALVECRDASDRGLLWREDACLLYAARQRCVKPQPYAYSESPEINELFDAIGAA